MAARVTSNEANSLTAISPLQQNAYPRPDEPITMSGARLGPDPAVESEALRKERFLEIARQRFRVAVDAESPRRKEMRIDHQFYGGEQWDTGIRMQREQQRRPCLTINRIPGFVGHVVNNMRQDRPGIKVLPEGSGSDEDQAEVRQGLMRHIETDSQADQAYDHSFQDMCIGGLGVLRVVDDWEDPTSFHRRLVIRAVQNPFTVYWDPFAKQPDWSDIKWAFITEDLTVKEFKEQYGDDREAVSKAEFVSLGDNAPFWFPGGNIRVAEYFYVDETKDISCEMENGSVKLWSDLKKLKDPFGQQMYTLTFDNEGNRLVEFEGYQGRTRDCVVPKVKWAKISAVDILKEREWKGNYIPLIPVLGQRVQQDGNEMLVGMVRYAREPQRSFNYLWSSAVEMAALAPKAPFIAEVGQIPDGNEGIAWEKANTMPVSVLRYKRVTAEFGNSGALLPPPQRQQAEPPIQAFVQLLQIADQHLKSVFSIYEASLGQRGPQESGKAINARKVESETATFNWGDNFVRALKHLGNVLNDLLPVYYNEPGRVVQIIGDDESIKAVTLNKPFMEKGVEKQYDLSSGRYSVVISTGPSAETKRQENVAAMLELAKAFPNQMSMALDLLIRQADFPDADTVADRIKKTLPPGIADSEEDEQIPPAAKQLLEQFRQQNEVMAQQLEAATDERAAETEKQQWETLRTQMVEENKLTIAQLKAANEESKILVSQLFQEFREMKAALMQQTVGQQTSSESVTAPAEAVGQGQ